MERTCKGHSLLELIVCITLLALIVTFLLNLLPNSLAMLRQAENRNQASKLARSLLEQAAAQPFSQLNINTTSQSSYDPFNTTFSIWAVPNSDPNYLKDLRVTVQWQERGGPRSLTQDLLIHNLPI